MKEFPCIEDRQDEEDDLLSLKGNLIIYHNILLFPLDIFPTLTLTCPDGLHQANLMLPGLDAGKSKGGTGPAIGNPDHPWQKKIHPSARKNDLSSRRI
ncbi:MAG: hypothetical protein ABSD81_02145 [Methanomicrobiales archaeon]